MILYLKMRLKLKLSYLHLILPLLIIQLNLQVLLLSRLNMKNLRSIPILLVMALILSMKLITILENLTIS